MNQVLGAGKSWSLGERIGIDLIRAHTKTSDIDHVTDDQLLTYRDTAIEQAELFTGLVLSGMREVEERLPVKAPRYRAATIPYKTRHPVADGIVYYASQSGMKGVADIDPGTRKFYVPAFTTGLYGENLVQSCCDPCGGGVSQNPTLKVNYRAGYKCAADVPQGIVLGVLKFVAWSTEHAGDMLITMASTTAARDSGIIGTNNGVWASGALELWRSYVVDGF